MKCSCSFSCWALDAHLGPCLRQTAMYSCSVWGPQTVLFDLLCPLTPGPRKVHGRAGRRKGKP